MKSLQAALRGALLRLLKEEQDTGNHADQKALHMATLARFTDEVKKYAIAEMAHLEGVPATAEAIAGFPGVLPGGSKRFQAVNAARSAFARQYAAEREWPTDPKKLSGAQIIEIRRQPGWCDPQAEE